MEEIDWAPLLRLQEQHAAAKDARTRDALEDVMTRTVEAIHRAQPRTGTVDTALANFRKRERRRGKLETLATPFMLAANDPWPELDRKIDREMTLLRLRSGHRSLIDQLLAGYSYREISEASDICIGTLKSQASRAKAEIAA